jgi:hypothetical protein
MKKSIIELIAVAVLSLSGVLVSEANIIGGLPQTVCSTTDYVTCKYGQCQATAKSTGEQCLHCVSNSGDLYCWQH